MSEYESTSSARDPASSWPQRKKWCTISTACLTCFIVGINSTAILAAAEDVSREFSIALEPFDYSFFLVTAWNAGAAVVPLVLLPAMEDFGVRPLYLSIYMLFVIFVVVQAVAQNFATLLVSRVIAGSCGGALQNAVDGMAADVWGHDQTRKALSLSVFILALLGGVTIGPVIGGATIKFLSWRWITYIQLIIYGAAFPLLFFCLHETRPSSGRTRASLKTRVKDAINETVLRSSRMLLTEFVLSTFTLWSAFSFGTVFLLTQSIPLVYTALYDWSPWQTGVVQVAILIGEILGFFLCVFQDTVIYPQFSRRKIGRQRPPETHRKPSSNSLDLDPENTAVPSSRSSALKASPSPSPSPSIAGQSHSCPTLDINNHPQPQPFERSSSSSADPSNPPNPESRLYTAIPLTLIGLTAGFFVYAWTSHFSLSWPLPTLGLLLIGMGITCIIQAVTVYITDFYSGHANSAVSAVAFGENILAAFLPLATGKMYSRDGGLGFGWASSLLGFVGLVLCLAPLGLSLGGGEKLRRKSKFAG